MPPGEGQPYKGRHMGQKIETAINEAEIVDGRILESLGAYPYSRRLTDKVLGAFTHAYALGVQEVSDNLLSMLNEAHGESTGPVPRRHHPANQASLWVSFVDARRDYESLLNASNADPVELEQARNRMVGIFKHWITIHR